MDGARRVLPDRLGWCNDPSDDGLGVGALSSPTVSMLTPQRRVAVVGELSALTEGGSADTSDEQSPSVAGSIPAACPSSVSALTEEGVARSLASGQRRDTDEGRASLASRSLHVPSSVSALTWGHAPARLIADARSRPLAWASATGGSTQGARRGYDRFF